MKDPWITNESLEIIYDKDYFLTKAKKHGKVDDWRIAQNLRNQTKVLVKNANFFFIKDQLEENKSGSRDGVMAVRLASSSALGSL